MLPVTVYPWHDLGKLIHLGKLMLSLASVSPP